VEAVAAENRKLTARTAELETKLTEAMAAPKQVAPAEEAAPNVAGGYDGALAKFHARDYKGAIADFKSLIDSGIEASLADNCHYWMGESYFALKQRTGKKADATFMMGNCYLALGNKASAKEAFQKVTSDYPTSPLVEKAKAKLAKLP
jgi:TolA-binding protein